MEGARAVLDERDDGLASRQAPLDQRRISAERPRIPSPTGEVPEQILTADATGGRVDQRRKRLGVHTGRSPVAHDHRDGGTAAQRFTLLQVRNVEEPDGLRGGRRLRARGGGYQEQQNPGARAAAHQSASRIIRITISRMRMIVVVVITTVVAPPASSLLTWRACEATCRRSSPCSVETAAEAFSI